MQFLESLAGFLDGVVWSQSLLYLLLLTGLWFSFRSRFLQVRLFGPMCTLLFGKPSSHGISSFQAFCTALAGRVGTGNIVGTSAAVLFGGPGAMFWMWLLAFLGAATSFVECTLAQLYKIKIDGQYRGGPAYYIERGLKQRSYAKIFAVVGIVASGILLPGVQSNSITSAFDTAFGAPTWLTGAIIAIILGIIIFGGIKRIAHTAEVIVPIMAVCYVVVSLIIIIANAGNIGHVFGMIFSSAFGLNSVFGGVLGSAITWGIKRGIYSNEAGQGTQPYAAGVAEVTHPAKQGLVQALGVYVDTLLICTCTGLVILLTDCFNVLGADGSFLHQGSQAVATYVESGPQFVQAAMGTVLGGFGPIFVSVCLAFFAFTTIMSYYYQAECNVVYLLQDSSKARNKAVVFGLRLAMVIVVFLACLVAADTIWDFGNIGVGATAWLNLLAILLLQKPAFICLKDFERQRKAGLDPVFDPDTVDIPNCDVWREINAGRMHPKE